MKNTKFEVYKKNGERTFVERFDTKEEAEGNWGWSENHIITEIEWTSEDEHIALLQQLPIEFRAWASSYAYDHGHSSGQEEINIILNNLINSGLKDAIKDFYKNC